MNHPCSLCGSRDWPREDTDCPQCYGEPEWNPNEFFAEDEEQIESLEDFPK
jgi:hypothetical protein